MLGRDFQRLSNWPSDMATQSMIHDTDPHNRWLLVMISLTHAILNIRFFVTHRNCTQISEIDAPMAQLNDSLTAHEDVLISALQSANRSEESTRAHFQVHFGGILILSLIVRSYASQLLADSLSQAIFLGPNRSTLQQKLTARMQHVLLEFIRNQTASPSFESMLEDCSNLS